MKAIIFTLLTAFTAATAYGDEPPPFFKETYPKSALDAAWTEYKAVYNNDGAITLKNKQLIALAVSAQIPCQYCIIAHTKKRKGSRRDARGDPFSVIVQPRIMWRWRSQDNVGQRARPPQA